jgi:hypothetical protein
MNAAFIVEPVQGEAGVIVPPDDYFLKVREICDKWGILPTPTKCRRAWDARASSGAWSIRAWLRTS